MAELNWKNCVGQDRVKEVLGAALKKGTLGHAYLLCGEQGTGTFAAALDLAMALLCRGETGILPCCACDSCRKVLNYSHPDFHVVMPLCLEKEHKTSDGKLSTEGWSFCSSSVLDRIKNTYAVQLHSGIPQIPVEWVREVNHAIIRGSLNGGKNVAILDGVDTMNKESANAMLKTLEEPPEDTVILLIAEQMHAVLPTIVSRCQILRFGFLAPEIIRSECAKRYSIDPSDRRLDAVADAGSLGSAMYLYENPIEEYTMQVVELWNGCVKKDWPAVISCIDRLAKIGESGEYERMFIQMMHLLRYAYLTGIPGMEMKYFTRNGSSAPELGPDRSPDKLEKVVKICQETVSAIRARGNIQLVLVNFALSVMEIM